MTRSCACAILAVAFVVPTSFAQTDEDILQDLAALTLRKVRVAKLETENARLRSSVADQNAQELERQISALTDRPVLHDPLVDQHRLHHVLSFVLSIS